MRMRVWIAAGMCGLIIGCGGTTSAPPDDPAAAKQAEADAIKEGAREKAAQPAGAKKRGGRVDRGED